MKIEDIEFEQYLQEMYVAEENPLDDDIPDGFNAWLENMDIDDFIAWGQKYAEQIFTKCQEGK